MLKMADLGVVGDLHEIVPILLRKLEALAADRRAMTDAAPEGAERQLMATGS
jgi:hypothetical protein